MKKIIPLIFMSFMTLGASAQLVVDYAGKVSLGNSTTSNYANVFAGHDYTGSTSSGTSIALHANNETSSGSYSIGVKGTSSTTATGARSIAVQGVATGGNSGYLYGVVGGIGVATKYGAGIFGTLSNYDGLYVGGRYAGYFDGAVRINGTATITTVVTPSDMRLKENIGFLRDYEQGNSTLDNVLRMNVVKYNYRQKPDGANDDKRYKTAYCGDTENTHYGLLAQELQKIYPDLVREGQDGYLGINYTELVPILIQCIQELKAEVNELKEMNGSLTNGGYIDNGTPRTNNYYPIVVDGKVVGSKRLPQQ